MEQQTMYRHSVGRKGGVILVRVDPKVYYVYDSTCPNCGQELVTGNGFTGCESCGYNEQPREDG